MSENDGGILGTPIPLLQSGPPESRFNIVVTGDGYANNQQDQAALEQIANDFVQLFQQEAWVAVLGGALNVWLVKVWSTSSRVSMPELSCSQQTYFEGTYCDAQGNYPEVNEDMWDVFRSNLQFEAHVIALALNTGNTRGAGSGWGGEFKLGDVDWPSIALHELGHAAWLVYDEYDAREDPDPDWLVYPGQISDTNLTIETTREAIPWRGFIHPDVPVPTLQSADCTVDPSNLPNPLADPYRIGLFQGGSGYNCGIYHPAYRCQMNSYDAPLCRVCVDAAREMLSGYASPPPAPHAEYVGNATLEFGEVPFGATMYRAFEIRNNRVGFPAPLDVTLSAGYVEVPGSASGVVVGQVKQVAIEAPVPGPIEVTVSWDPALQAISESGTVNKPPPLGATKTSVNLTVTGSGGNISLSVAWTSMGLTPTAAVNVDLELYDPNGWLVSWATGDSTHNPEHLAYFVAPGKEGTYRLDIVNKSVEAVSWTMSGSHPAHTPLTASLEMPGGAVVATATAAAPPVALSHSVPASATGTYTLVLQIAQDYASYDVDFTSPGPNDVLPQPFWWAEGTETAFTVPAPVLDAHMSRTVIIGFTAPQVEQEFNGALDVITGDTVNPAFHLTLHAKSAPPAPLDSVLVLDRSGSMGESTGTPGLNKSEVAIAAAKLYVSLLRPNDAIGIVRYNQTSANPGDVLLPMAGIGVGGAGQAEAQLTETQLDPEGSTSIGAGIITGSDILDAGSAPNRAIVILTDGIQNTDPDVPEARDHVGTKTPQQRVFAVGIGLNQLEDKLVEITGATEGVAHVTGTLSGPNEFLLQKLYVQILADAADEAFVTDPRVVLGPGEEQATPVHIGETDFEADFIVALRPGEYHPRYTEVWLETPSGTVIERNAAASMPNAEYVEDDAHVYYRVQFPPLPQDPDSHPGMWRLWVRNRWEEQDAPRAAWLYYAVMCKARSDFRLAGRVEQERYEPGSSMTIVLEPTLGGRFHPLRRPLLVRVRKPDGELVPVKVEYSRDRTYRGTFSDSRDPGRYLVSAEMVAMTPGGHRVTRHRDMTGIIFRRRDAKTKPKPGRQSYT